MWKGALFALYIGILCVAWNDFSTIQIVISAITLILVLLGPHLIWALFTTGGRDIKALSRYLSLRWRISTIKRRDVGVPSMFQEVVRRHPNKIAFFFEEEKWTFQQLEDYSNRVANYFRTQGVKHGDCVALIMENRVEYVATWLGLSKLGAVPALVNTNLRLGPLVHCITIVESSLVIVGHECQEAIKEISSDINNLKVYVGGPSTKEISVTGAVDLDEELKNVSTDSPPEINSVKFGDKMVYIYTSGTTGLPKAAVIKHSRGFLAAQAATLMIGISPTDVIYSPLPLYHLASGLVGAGQSFLGGNSVVIKLKFSASNYWKDCIRYNVTVAQYIGELCRYLLNTPSKPEDTKHQVRLMFGNGLRPEIWSQFQERFQVKTISEFYGATEGNANIINMDGKPGAIGFLSVILPSFYPCALIKVDESTGKPLRDEKGICIRCKPGEPGEFVGRIIRNDPVRDFHGYADKKATESKIVKDVWKKGDLAFLSGDILEMDHEGYLYFKDRRGDTFRWKGENVSTTEVEGIVSRVAGMTDVVVYGVEVPGAEGRTGMAAILDPTEKVNLEDLAQVLKKNLPSYAQPLFLRLVTKLDMTGTYKLKKTNLRQEAFDVDNVKDKMFFLDQRKCAYLPLDKDLHSKIVSGEIRL